MIARATRLLAVALVLVPASAAADAGTTRPPIALTASPSHVTLSGTARATIRLTNTGASRVVVDVSRASFALDLRGRPRIVDRAGRSAAGWLAFGPRRVAVAPGASAPVTIASTLPRRVEPGDHDALVLFTTRSSRRDGVAVRMRMGVVVVVRAPGTVVHRLSVGGLRIARSGRGRMLELFVANRGNVTEAIERAGTSVSLFAGGRRVARVAAVPRELRPRTRGVVQFRCPARVRGWVTARIAIRVESGRIVARAFRIRL